MSIEIPTDIRRLVLEFLRGKKSCRKSLKFWKQNSPTIEFGKFFELNFINLTKKNTNNQTNKVVKKTAYTKVKYYAWSFRECSKCKKTKTFKINHLQFYRFEIKVAVSVFVIHLFFLYFVKKGKEF